MESMNRRNLLLSLGGGLLAFPAPISTVKREDGTYCRLTVLHSDYEFMLTLFVIRMGGVVLYTQYDGVAKALVEKRDYHADAVWSGRMETWRDGKMVQENSFTDMKVEHYSVTVPCYHKDGTNFPSADKPLELAMDFYYNNKDQHV